MTQMPAERRSHTRSLAVSASGGLNFDSRCLRLIDGDLGTGSRSVPKWRVQSELRRQLPLVIRARGRRPV